jgi:hypothetical protein
MKRALGSLLVICAAVAIVAASAAFATFNQQPDPVALSESGFSAGKSAP